ncbi:metal-dependent hydrolase family protein [Paremcibacter congregatus]|uniref:Xaa-Pro dipeptidase n=1 Tax=Paremcibacter congregatus TaxID=2043170 RepID=A0A2G4YTC5_9PROT|nr:amidohydrolase family protein [Paremcibacter congregatus]PHZ85575.1 Xaa-Pro dipeptidase [Paremcibacter congregatus]QDE26535.1 amidohydrolase family protein [Paremcibacter congregatus]
MTYKQKLISGLLGATFGLGLFTPATLAEEAKKDNWTLIHAGTLLADARKKPTTEQTILIKNDKIVDIKAGYLATAEGVTDPKIIDLKDQFVMAGMIDSHTHITGELSPRGRLDAVTMTESDYVLEGAVYARRVLNAGFTTIRNVGGPREAVFALRDGIQKGLTLGPRIVAGGLTISPTGGHGDHNGYRPDVFGDPDSGICDGADACRHAVRDQIKYGADMIKYVATGGVLSKIATGTGQQFTDVEQAAIVESAHAMGRKVAAHAHGKGGIEAALRAGVDSIEHGTYLDKDTIKLFKKTGAYLVPTVLAGVTVAEIAENKPGFFIPAVADKAKRVGPRMLDMLKRAYEGGVKIAFGTDSGVSKHGINGRELELMVEAGMPEQAVLVAATVNAAELADRADQIGTLEKGKSADIIAAAGNPLENILTLRTPSFVMAQGRIAVE